MLERSLELAMALEHLHHHMPETFVVHRDLKPDNVGFKADGTLKLVSHLSRVCCVLLQCVLRHSCVVEPQEIALVVGCWLLCVFVCFSH